MAGRGRVRIVRVRHPGQFVGLLVLVAITVSLLASFASFRAAAGTSILRRHVAATPPLLRGVEVDRGLTVGGTTFTADQFFSEALTRAAAMPSSVQAVPSIEVQRTVLAPHLGFVSLTWRPEQCAHLRIVAGRCPMTGEALVNEATARLLHWRVGTKLTLNDVPTGLTVAGLYRPPPDDPYWFGNVYFTPQGIRIAVDSAVGTYDAFFVARETVASPPPGSRATFRVAFGVDAGEVSPADVPRLHKVVAEETAWGRRLGATVSSPVDSALRAADRSSALMTRNSFVFLAQLVLALAVVLFVVAGSVLASRWEQVSVLRFRGVSLRRTIGLVLGDLVVAVAVAYPVGVLLGVAAAAALARTSLSPHVTPRLDAASWAYGAVALSAAVVTFALAFAVRLLEARRPEPSAPHVVRRRGWAVDAVLAALAAAGAIELFGKSPHDGTGSGTFLILPGVGALLGALLLSRASTAGAAVATRSRFSDRHLSLYVALRQLARLGLGVRLAVVIVSGMAFVTFAAAQSATLHGNYAAAAMVTVGAPAVVEVAPGTSLPAAVHAADPVGGHATGGYVTARADMGDTATVAVDTRTFADVVATPATGLGDLRRFLAQLRPAVAAPILVTGDRLDFTLDETSGPADLRHDVMVTLDNKSAHRSYTSTVGALRSGRELHAHVSLTGCFPSCELRAITLTSSGTTTMALQRPAVSLTLRLRDVSVVDGSRSRPIAVGELPSSAWRGYGTAPAPGMAVVTPSRGALQVSLRGDPLNPLGFGPASYPAPLPAIASGAPLSGNARGLDGALLPVHAVARAAALPVVQTGGYLVDADLAVRAAVGVSDDTHVQVWLSRDLPASVAVARLHRAGITVLGTRSADAVAAGYRHDGPGVAVALSLVAAVAGAAVTFTAVVLTIASTMRRRARELSPLVEVGGRHRTLVGYLLLEQVLLIGPGLVIGAVLGTVAARVVTPRLAEYVVAPHAPLPAFPLHLWLALTAVVVAAALVLPALVVVSRRSLTAAVRAAGTSVRP